MKTMQSPHACVLAFCLSALLCSPNEIMASPDTPQRAGEVSRVIPAVSIARGGKSISASAKTVVDWQKITKPDGKFEVKTPAGVAGVVGTDFYVAFDNSTGTMNVVVFEGIVKVCNLAGVCVLVKAGQMTNVRSNDSTGPQAPTQATLDVLVDAGTTTDAGGRPGVQNVGHHLGKGAGITLGILAIIPAIVIPVVATHGNNSKPPVPVTGCAQNPKLCG